MTEERKRIFLYEFYKEYILQCFKGLELASDDLSLRAKVGEYDIRNYVLSNLDIYIQTCDIEKEYERIYDSKLFYTKKQENAEAFNDLQIFLIEHIQLFIHTIVEEAIRAKLLADGKSIEKMLLIIKVIDNEEVILLELIETAEKNMIEKGFSPPARG